MAFPGEENEQITEKQGMYLSIAYSVYIYTYIYICIYSHISLLTICYYTTMGTKHKKQIPIFHKQQFA